MDPISRKAELERLAAAARAAWPGIKIPADVFRAFVEERVGKDESPEEIRALRSGDLYLACGCLLGDEQAITSFEGSCLGVVDHALARLRVSPSTVDEVKQTLREQLFVAGPGVKPLLANYAGRGALSGWLRVVAVRTAIRLIDRGRHEVPVPNVTLEEVFGSSQDPELEYLRSSYRESFRSAVKQALRQLTSRQRNLLTQHYLDRLSIPELSTVYRVHRSTMFRWIEQAKATLVDHTRGQLMAELRMNRQECESLMRLVDSRLEVTMSFLAEDESD